jgi:hypothetical protein
MSAASKFIAQLRRDPRFSGKIATDIAEALDAMESESHEVEGGASFMRAVEWIISQDLTAEQKLHHINRLLALGKVEDLNLRKFIRLQ